MLYCATMCSSSCRSESPGLQGAQGSQYSGLQSALLTGNMSPLRSGKIKAPGNNTDDLLVAAEILPSLSIGAQAGPSSDTSSTKHARASNPGSNASERLNVSPPFPRFGRFKAPSSKSEDLLGVTLPSTSFAQQAQASSTRHVRIRSQDASASALYQVASPLPETEQSTA